jgi:hypothetical protein
MFNSGIIRGLVACVRLACLIYICRPVVFLFRARLLVCSHHVHFIGVRVLGYHLSVPLFGAINLLIGL